MTQALGDADIDRILRAIMPHCFGCTGPQDRPDGREPMMEMCYAAAFIFARAIEQAVMRQQPGDADAD